jgi:hypothetical protein
MWKLTLGYGIQTQLKEDFKTFGFLGTSLMRKKIPLDKMKIINIHYVLLEKTWVKSNQLTQFYFVILFSMMTIFKRLSFSQSLCMKCNSFFLN